MNIAIIEDEIMTAEDLAEIIGRLDNDIRLSATLHSVKSALAYFQEQPPIDLIFADIQLGDGLSFEIFRTVRIAAPIIFCTAYDEYALEAIRSNGIDYILKPFTAETVIRAIDKYHRLKRHFVPIELDYDKLIRSISGADQVSSQAGSILVYHKDKIVPVGFEAIALFYVEGELTRLHGFNNKNYVVNQSLEDLEELTPPNFFRINRQFLVNRRAIIDANHYLHRKYVINLSVPFKETLIVSKNRTTAFLQWLTRK